MLSPAVLTELLMGNCVPSSDHAVRRRPSPYDGPIYCLRQYLFMAILHSARVAQCVIGETPVVVALGKNAPFHRSIPMTFAVRGPFCAADGYRVTIRNYVLLPDYYIIVTGCSQLRSNNTKRIVTMLPNLHPVTIR